MTKVPRPNAHSAVAQQAYETLLRSSFVYVALWAVVDLTAGAYVAGGIATAATLVLFPLTCLASRRGRGDLARLMLIFTFGANVFAGQVLVARFAGFSFYFLPLGILPLLVFARERRGWIAAGVSLGVSFWLAAELPHLYGFFAPWRPTLSFLPALHAFNFVSAFAMTLALVIIYARALRKAERSRVAEFKVTHGRLQAAYDQLALSERVLAEMFNGMVEGVMIFGPEGKILRMNATASRIMGFTVETPPEEIAAMGWEMASATGEPLTPEQMPGALAFSTGRVQSNVTVRIRHSGGPWRWLNASAAPCRNDERTGAVTHIVATFSDITERRRADRLLYDIVNGTPDWITITDANHRFVTVNEAFATAAYVEPENLVGRSQGEFSALLGDVAENERVLTSSRALTIENSAVRVVGGTERTFHVVKVPLFEDGASAPYAVLSYARDITRLKDVERRMLQSSKMASLGQMASGIAHEVNNPLAIIKTTADLLRSQVEANRVDPTKAVTALTKIGTTVDRIAKVVRGLKSYSREDEQEAFQAVSLSQVVEDSLALCADRFKSHGVTLQIADLPNHALFGSAAQLSQVLLNLLNNAFDAVEHGTERWVEVSSKREGDRVRVIITDGGPAIPDDVREKLMQPFFTTKAVGKGTGLGLMISQKIVARHGGRLYLDPQSPRTSFVIDLPVHNEMVVSANAS